MPFENVALPGERINLVIQVKPEQLEPYAVLVGPHGLLYLYPRPDSSPHLPYVSWWNVRFGNPAGPEEFGQDLGINVILPHHISILIQRCAHNIFC